MRAVGEYALADCEAEWPRRIVFRESAGRHTEETPSIVERRRQRLLSLTTAAQPREHARVQSDTMAAAREDRRMQWWHELSNSQSMSDKHPAAAEQEEHRVQWLMTRVAAAEEIDSPAEEAWARKDTWMFCRRQPGCSTLTAGDDGEISLMRS